MDGWMDGWWWSRGADSPRETQLLLVRPKKEKKEGEKSWPSAAPRPPSPAAPACASCPSPPPPAGRPWPAGCRLVRCLFWVPAHAFLLSRRRASLLRRHPLEFFSRAAHAPLISLPHNPPVADNVKYAKTHEWAKQEGDTVTVGISDHAQVRARETHGEFSAGGARWPIERARSLARPHRPRARRRRLPHSRVPGLYLNAMGVWRGMAVMHGAAVPVLYRARERRPFLPRASSHPHHHHPSSHHSLHH